MHNRPRFGWVLWAIGAALIAVIGFAMGFAACLHAKSASADADRIRLLQLGGDAPPEVRAGVLTALKALQDGYAKRDVKELNAFMSRLFAKDADVLILGTDTGEWERGYAQAAEFIGDDWKDWGDLRFAADDSIVWSSGDVAWIATVGAVRWKGAERPMRLSAVLVRQGDHWIFRQLQFQWDDRDPALRDLLQPRTIRQIMQWMFHRIAGGNTQQTQF